MNLRQKTPRSRIKAICISIFQFRGRVKIITVVHPSNEFSQTMRDGGTYFSDADAAADATLGLRRLHTHAPGLLFFHPVPCFVLAILILEYYRASSPLFASGTNYRYRRVARSILSGQFGSFSFCGAGKIH